MSQVEKSEQDLDPELWHTYAGDRGRCPDTWERELGEWQFDGVDESGATQSDSKCNQYHDAKPRCSSPLRVELTKWLPAT